MKHLVLGGVRSGKSRYAESLAKQSQQSVYYIATAQSLDTEMQTRIAAHQAQRPRDWLLIEAPIALASALQANAANHHCLLVDCLTLWVSNLLLHDNPQQLDQQCDNFLSCVNQLPGDLILVSNEVGFGGVPMQPLSRQFCDITGHLHQVLAEHCDTVTLVVAGIPLPLKHP